VCVEGGGQRFLVGSTSKRGAACLLNSSLPALTICHPYRPTCNSCTPATHRRMRWTIGSSQRQHYSAFLQHCAALLEHYCYCTAGADLLYAMLSVNCTAGSTAEPMYPPDACLLLQFEDKCLGSSQEEHYCTAASVMHCWQYVLCTDLPTYPTWCVSPELPQFTAKRLGQSGSSQRDGVR
jgi:hypothetical protein